MIFKYTHSTTYHDVPNNIHMYTQNVCICMCVCVCVCENIVAYLQFMYVFTYERTVSCKIRLSISNECIKFNVHTEYCILP